MALQSTMSNVNLRPTITSIKKYDIVAVPTGMNSSGEKDYVVGMVIDIVEKSKNTKVVVVGVPERLSQRSLGSVRLKRKSFSEGSVKLCSSYDINQVLSSKDDGVPLVNLPNWHGGRIEIPGNNEAF